MTSGWSLKFSFGPVNSHAWGVSIGEEFASKDARLCLLTHKKGSVYLTLATEGSNEAFLLDFGRYWQMSTYKRWGTSFITYRSGSTGLFLDFPGVMALQDYEDCCDRLLSEHSGGGPAPTLKVLRNLGVVSRPTLEPGLPTDAQSSSSDEETDSGSSVYSADHVDEEVFNMLEDELGDLHMPA